MHRINNCAGTNITIYHEWHEETDYYKKHIWRCTGPCRTRRPYFGFVKRVSNRAPGPNDRWWTKHQVSSLRVVIYPFLRHRAMEHLKKWVSRLPEKGKRKNGFEKKWTVGSPASPRLWVKRGASPQPTWWRRIDLALVMSSVAEKREFRDFWIEKTLLLRENQNLPINWAICSVQKTIRENYNLEKFDRNLACFPSYFLHF